MLPDALPEWGAPPDVGFIVRSMSPDVIVWEHADRRIVYQFDAATYQFPPGGIPRSRRARRLRALDDRARAHRTVETLPRSTSSPPAIAELPTPELVADVAELPTPATSSPTSPERIVRVVVPRWPAFIAGLAGAGVVELVVALVHAVH